VIRLPLGLGASHKSSSISTFWPLFLGCTTLSYKLAHQTRFRTTPNCLQRRTLSVRSLAKQHNSPFSPAAFPSLSPNDHLLRRSGSAFSSAPARQGRPQTLFTRSHDEPHKTKSIAHCLGPIAAGSQSGAASVPLVFCASSDLEWLARAGRNTLELVGAKGS